jgi:prepilin-type processing-associated H-X9-DG protein
VANGTPNWGGQPVNPGSNRPPAQGGNLVWSYRHGCAGSNQIRTSAQSNAGSINALFFDGHVAQLRDRASRKVTYWYPKGAIVQEPSEGMTRVDAGWEIP